MNTIPIPPEIEAQFPNFRKVVVGSPTGKLDGDGSSPDEAFAVEALFGKDDQGWAQIRELWLPDANDLEDIARGCPIELVFWLSQMPVHGMNVQPFVVRP